MWNRLVFLLHNLELSETVPDIFLKQRLEFRMPPAERGPALRDILGRPLDPQLIQLTSRLIIGNKDVEIASANAVQHVQHRLRGRPRARGLLHDGASSGKASVRPPRAARLYRNTCWDQGGERGEGMCVHEEVGSELGGFLPELVGEAFSETFDGSFGGVVGCIASAQLGVSHCDREEGLAYGGLVMPCLEPVLMTALGFS